MSPDGSLIFDTAIDNSGFDADLGKLTSSATTAGAAVAATFATITVAASAAAAEIGMAYESAFAGVKKTVNETASITYADISTEIRNMAKNDMPAAASSISAVAEAAGQLGIATKDITNFSEVMINLGEATNLSADIAASSLAKFANITQMDASNYENLGSTIVALGNNFATTEADIVSMSMRLASAGTTAKMSETDILGFSTAMSSVGIEAEAGGSAMSTFIKRMQTAVETGEGLEDFAEIAGMTAEAFTNLWNSNAAGAVTAFIGNLNNVEQHGRSAVQILDEMGMTEIRLSNTLLALANSGDLMTRAISLSNEAWEENVALSEEVEKRYATTESIMNITKNNLADIGITVYDKFQQPLVSAFEAATDGLQEFNDNLSGGELSGKLDKVADSFEKVSVAAVEMVTSDVLPAMINGMAAVVEHGEEIVFVGTEIAAVFVAWQVGTVIQKVVVGFQTANLQVTLLAAQSGKAAVAQTALAGSLKLSEVAVSLFTGKITLATAAQTVFNRTVAAHPFGALLAALAAVTVATVAFSNSIKKAAEEMETAAPMQGFVQNCYESIEAMQAQKAEFDNLSESLKKQEAAENAEINNIQKLWTELQNYVDENGRVIASNERASEIIGLLNNNYDMNIGFINGQIEGYGELANSMDAYIEKLRLEARIRNNQPAYDDAIKNIDELQSRLEKLQNEEKRKLAAFSSAEGNADIQGVFSEQLNAVRAEKAEVEKLISEYQGVADEYEKLFAPADSLGSSVYTDSQKAADEAYAKRRAEEAEALIKARETATEKLQESWEQLEHDYAADNIKSEEELYAKKREIWEKYGDASYKDHWEYYEDLIQYDKDFAAEQQRLAEQAATAEEQAIRDKWDNIDRLNQMGFITDGEAMKRRKQFIADYYPEYSAEAHDYYKQIYDEENAIVEEGLKKQEEIVDDGLNDILDAHRKAYDELNRQRESYRNKLMAVGGDLFSVDVSKDKDGNEVTTYAVNNLDEQLRKMKEYHRQVSALKQRGASAGLLEELTSLGDEESAQFAKHLAGMSATEFAKINDLYNEKQKLADELAGDLYKSEAQDITDSMTTALTDLATSAYSYGASAAEQFSAGFSAAANELGFGALYNQIQAAGANRNYENYITVAQNENQTIDINVDVTEKSTITLDGKVLGENVTNYQHQETRKKGK